MTTENSIQKKPHGNCKPDHLKINSKRFRIFFNSSSSHRRFIRFKDKFPAKKHIQRKEAITAIMKYAVYKLPADYKYTSTPEWFGVDPDLLQEFRRRADQLNITYAQLVDAVLDQLHFK